MYLSLSLCLSLSLSSSFFGHVIYPHHSDQMSQRSQVSRITLWRCSLNVFVFVIVFVFVFVVVFFLVRSCLLITLIKCLKGHKSLGLLFEGFLLMSLSLSILVRSFLLITLIKYIKGKKSLALCGCSLNVKNVFSYDTSLNRGDILNQKSSTPPSISVLRGSSVGALAIWYLYSSSFTCSHIYLLFGHVTQTSWDEKLKQF